jgi:type IV secretion system protein VirB6
VGFASGLGAQSSNLVMRLQAVDDGIVAITTYGTGRLSGGVTAGSEISGSFKGIALADQFGFGTGRAGYLVGTLIPFGTLRLGAGILLALAPLMAGLLLFGGTSGIFFGWVRGLTFCAFGSLMQALIQGVELAVMEPWLRSVLDGRQSNTFTPSAPTELFVLSLAFAGISLGLLLLCGRFVFFQSWGRLFDLRSIPDMRSGHNHQAARQGDFSDAPMLSRAEIIASNVNETVRRERLGAQVTHMSGRQLTSPDGNVSSGRTLGSNEHIHSGGTEGIRRISRTSASTQIRDRKT